MSNAKGRNLSALEYIKVLEVEWWVCNLRRKIYPTKNDKSHFGKVSLLKRNRIIEISERNEIPHIFSDSEMMKELNKRFSAKGGCPDFPGRNEDDIEFYFYQNNEVRCFYGFDKEGKSIIKLGKIRSFDIESSLVEVEFEKKNTDNLDMTMVTRIF